MPGAVYCADSYHGHTVFLRPHRLQNPHFHTPFEMVVVCRGWLWCAGLPWAQLYPSATSCMIMYGHDLPCINSMPQGISRNLSDSPNVNAALVVAVRLYWMDRPKIPDDHR